MDRNLFINAESDTFIKQETGQFQKIKTNYWPHCEAHKIKKADKNHIDNVDLSVVFPGRKKDFQFCQNCLLQALEQIKDKAQKKSCFYCMKTTLVFSLHKDCELCEECMKKGIEMIRPCVTLTQVINFLLVHGNK